MEPRPNREQSVREYVELELELSHTKGDGIDHLELLVEEFVLGERFEVWDCRTIESGRWWVAGPLLNVYSQDDFKSVDYLLSFHIGLMHRIRSRSEPDASYEELDEFTEIWRRWQQASDMLDESEEGEDFQSVGLRLRETLVALTKYIANRSDYFLGPDDLEETPKTADFVGWATITAEKLAGGSSKKRLRAYMKSIAQDGWQYVNWLTHKNQAIRPDAEMGLRIVEHIVGVYGSEILGEHRRRPPRSCGDCGSYLLQADRYRDNGVLMVRRHCDACGWDSGPVADDEPITAPMNRTIDLTTECTPASDGPGTYP